VSLAGCLTSGEKTYITCLPCFMFPNSNFIDYLQYKQHISFLSTYTIMSGDKPWPEVPIGNKDHTNAAVVIIGAGISGKFPRPHLSHLQLSQSILTLTSLSRHLHSNRPHKTQQLQKLHHPRKILRCRRNMARQQIPRRLL
jgi:hypothetical protein